MIYRKFFAILPLILPYCLFAQLPAVVSGKIVRIENFESKYVTARHIDVWLPEGYNGKKKFAVLYMHDGQMLYDSAGAWNKQSWDVDDAVARLQKQKKIRDVIVVGVWNGGPSRHPDYFPQKPFESLTEAQRDGIYQAARTNGVSVFGDGKIQSDNYLKFLVTELKPYIDKTYATRKDRKNTFVAGSSMGGLISMYALCEYPDVFGGAACLSTHWPGIFTMENNPIPQAFVTYLQEHLPNPKTHKLYFDYGTETLDALYPPLQEKVDAVMKSKGWTSKNWMTREFKGDDHSERAWRKRLEIPLTFLLAK
jgi:enterochelin esterase-like enzyme